MHSDLQNILSISKVVIYQNVWLTWKNFHSFRFKYGFQILAVF